MKQKKKFKTFISCALVSAMLLSSSSSMMAEQIEVTETQEIYNRLFEAGSSVFVSEDDQSEYWPSMGIMPLLSTPTDGAWKKGANGKWWFEYTNKSYPANKWEVIDGYWYYFDGQGYMVTGDFYYPKDGKWYYLAPVKSTLYPEGAMVMDYWLKTTGEKWYYYGTDGALVTGNKTIAGVSYMFDSHGVCINPNPPKSAANTAMYVLTANDLIDGSSNKIAIVETIKHMRGGLGKTTTFYDAPSYYPNYPRMIYEQLPYNELVVLHGHGSPGLLVCSQYGTSSEKYLYASKNITDNYNKSLDDYLPGQLSNVKLVYMPICKSARADSTGHSLASMLQSRGCKTVIGFKDDIARGEFYGEMFFGFLNDGYSVEVAKEEANKQFDDEYAIQLEGNILILGDKNQVLKNKSKIKKAPVGEHYIDEQWNNIQFCSDIELNYFGTKNIEMDTYDGDTIIKKLHRYEEKEGVFYTLDNQSRFYSIMNFNEKDATVDIGEEEIIKNIYSFLEGKIENLEDYKVDNIQKIEDCYEMQLKNSVDDIIDLEVESDGNIQSMRCRYNDGKELSDEEKQYFNTEFNDYIKEHLRENETYKYTVNYEKIDGQICAFYTTTFEDNDGITHSEIIIIA